MKRPTPTSPPLKQTPETAIQSNRLDLVYLFVHAAFILRHALVLLQLIFSHSLYLLRICVGLLVKNDDNLV